MHEFSVFCISCTKYRGEPVERQNPLERKTVWSAMFLLGGYFTSLLVEYASLNFTLTSKGYWRIEHANDVSTWVILLAIVSVFLSIVPAFFFLVSLHKTRKNRWTSRNEKANRKDLLYYFALYQAGFGITSFVYFFLPYPLFQGGTVGSILEGALPQLLMLGSALYLFKGNLREIGFVKPHKWQWLFPFILFFYFFNITSLALHK